MKILITGNVGSGKTYLANILSEYYDIKHFELDLIVHDIDNNDKKRTELEQTKLINKINKENKHYIIEGVLRKNQDIVLTLVDQIIFLYFDKKEIKKRIKKRYIKQLLHIEKSSYKPTKDMYKKLLKWNKEFDNELLLKRLKKYNNKLIIIKNKKELNKYLESIYKNGNYLV